MAEPVLRRLTVRCTALLATGAMALGIAGMHVSEHGHGAWLESGPETVAACPDGLQDLHFDAPRLIRHRSCPACLLAHIAIADHGGPAPSLTRPAAPRTLTVDSAPAPVRPESLARAPRGPPSLASGS